MGLFKKKEKEKKYASEEERLFEESFDVSEDGSISVLTDGKFRGVAEKIDLIPYVESKGWRFVTMTIAVGSGRIMREGMIVADYVFRKVKKNED